MTRIVEAIGDAGFITASFTIIASEFPTSVATTFVRLCIVSDCNRFANQDLTHYNFMIYFAGCNGNIFRVWFGKLTFNFEAS